MDQVPGDDGRVPRCDHARSDGAGDDIKIPGDHRRAFCKPGLRRGARRYPADDVGRVGETRQQVCGIGQSVKRQQLIVISTLRQAQEASSRTCRRCR